VNVDLGIWSKLTRLIIVLICVAGVLAVAVWYYPLIQQNERMRREIMRLDAQIAKADESNRLLRGSVDALRFDPKALERLAREELGYAKPGETIIRFETPNFRR
jgi:cell division protein FtsB